MEMKPKNTIASEICEIPIELIDGFPNNPFGVREDGDMTDLIESIKERGLLSPADVRPKDDGRYELISGHRRKFACKKLGMETMPCRIVELSDDEATVVMVESNFQRSTILPSEKGFAYKMRLEAMKRMPGRPRKENASQVETDCSGTRSDDELAKNTGESRAQIHRFIRLTNLVPDLRRYVDEGKMKMQPAIELSYIDENVQRELAERIEQTKAFPSYEEAKRIRKANSLIDTSYKANKVKINDKAVFGSCTEPPSPSEPKRNGITSYFKVYAEKDDLLPWPNPYALLDLITDLMHRPDDDPHKISFLEKVRPSVIEHCSEDKMEEYIKSVIIEKANIEISQWFMKHMTLIPEGSVIYT